MSDDDRFDLGTGPVPTPQRVATSSDGVISTQHWEASRVGASVLSAGGNAVDAAVAASLALGVCEPAASGIGGQTMMLIHIAEPRTTFALDGSSRAPHRAVQDQFNSHDELKRGHRATTVPSTLATLDYALSQYGTMSFASILDPVIALAEEGFVVSELQQRLVKRELEHLRAGSAGRFYLDPHGNPPAIGDTFRHPVLAKTLRRLADHGVADFYQGEIARHIHQDMMDNDGLIRDDDLAQIPVPIERRPVTCRFGSARVVTFPPPGAGRTLIEMLNIYSALPESLRDFDEPKGALALASVIRQGLRDRRDRPYDPEYYQQVDDRQMTDRSYAEAVAKRIRKGMRKPRRPIPSSGETTHLSVMDRYGNAVALTQSIERVYGSFEASPELGFLYNKYMSAFDYEDMSHPYYLRPNAVPWASVAPTVVFRGTRPWLTIGSPGSERIAPTVLQVMLRLMSERPLDAVSAPRLHCSLKGRVSIEASRVRSDVLRTLVDHGFEINRRDPYSFYLGCCQLVLRIRGGLLGVADPRRDGAAEGAS